MSKNSEIAVLGAIILENELIYDVISKLQVSDFLIPAHQLIFEAMLSLYDDKKDIDYITLEEKLGDKNYGGLEYLVTLPDRTPIGGATSSVFDSYVAYTKKDSIRSQLSRLGSKITTTMADRLAQPQDLLDEIDKDLSVINGSESIGVYTTEEIIAEICKDLEEAAKYDSPIIGLPSGLAKLDEYTAGFQNGELIVIGGRPSMGKTAGSLNMVRHMGVEADIPILFFSCEMKRTQILHLLACLVLVA